jgi:hypothetical protein
VFRGDTELVGSDKVSRVTKNNYRAAVENLSVLISMSEAECVVEVDLDVHHNAMEELVDQIRSMACPSLPKREQEEAVEIMSRADQLVAAYRARNGVQFCFTMQHPKFGVCGGGPSDQWYGSMDAVAKMAQWVDPKYTVSFLRRDLATGSIVVVD